MPQNNHDKITVYVAAEIKELVPGYLQNRQEDVKTLRSALVRGDYETIRILGHTLKGTGSSYGFDPITALGGSLEGAAQAKNPEEIKKSVEELSRYLERIEVVYE